MRTPEFPVRPLALGWRAGGDALGECRRCADVVHYEPESLPPGQPLLCRPCRPTSLGLTGF